MKIKISSWKTLINNELKRLYEGKTVKLWFAQYGPKTQFRTHYKYACYTTKEEFNDPQNWYGYVNLQDVDVVIKSITGRGTGTKFLEIKFDPIIYQGTEISSILFSNKILDII